MQFENENHLERSLALTSELRIYADTVAQVECYLNTWLEENDYFEDEMISCNTSFAEMGLSSIDSVGLLEDLKNEMAIKLDAMAAWRFPNVTKLARHVADLKEKQAQANHGDKDKIERDVVNVIKQKVATTGADTGDELNVEQLALELEKLISQHDITINQGERCE